MTLGNSSWKLIQKQGREQRKVKENMLSTEEGALVSTPTLQSDELLLILQCPVKCHLLPPP